VVLRALAELPYGGLLNSNGLTGDDWFTFLPGFNFILLGGLYTIGFLVDN
jgi:hypothetical protein